MARNSAGRRRCWASRRISGSRAPANRVPFTTSRCCCGYVKYIGPLPGGAQPIGSTTTAPVPIPAAPITMPSQTTTTRATGSATTSNSDGSCPAAAPIKVSRSGIYHLPNGDGNDDRTKVKSCYATPAAQAAGDRGIK